MKRVFFLIAIGLGLSVLTKRAIADGAKLVVNDDVVSVLTFGAKGDGQTDDAAALTKAIIYCVQNHKTCSIPKTDNFYNISSTIRIPLEPGQSINIVSNGATIKPLTPPINSSGWKLTAFKEHNFMSIGKQISSYQNIDMFKYSAGSSINISGLVFDGSNFPGQFAPTSVSTDIFIGLQALAETVNITDCSFKNLYGYGLVIYNVKNSVVNNCKFENVGGRGSTAFVQKVDHDAFGDGIHYSLVKADGKITIQNCIFQGMKIQGKRSRDAITFEFSTQPYNILLSNDNISGFAKCLQMEETAPAIVHIDHVNMSDFNLAIANVVNDKSTVFLNHVRMDIGLSDGNDPGDALAFLNYRSRAQIYVDSSYLNFNGKKQAYQSAVGLVKVQNSTINGNQTNFFFADGSTAFDNCTFIGFGGPGKSFSSNTGQSVYQISKSTFKGGSSINAKGQKLKLSIGN
jgi:hypothetical protein